MDDRVSDYIDDLLEQIDELEKENAALKTEIAELKTPDYYSSSAFLGEGASLIYFDVSKTMAPINLLVVCEVCALKKVKSLFAVKHPHDERGDDIQTFFTREEAEAFAASLKGEVEGKA